MRQLVIKSFVFTLVIAMSMYMMFVFAPNGYSDGHYQKFTTPPQTSLIIGTSQAAQGIRPEVLNNILGRTDVYNYSFTFLHSPYGPAYLRSIQRKLDPQTDDGIFVLSVDPWSIACTNDDPYDSASFPENELPIGIINNVNTSPNIKYLLQCYDYQYYRLFVKAGALFLHDNGWLEVNIPVDSASIRERTNERTTHFEKNPEHFQYSGLRYNYLVKTISFLQKHGTVYLVRLPTHPDWVNLEHKLFPAFEDQMRTLRASVNVPFLDLSSQNKRFIYTDGIHLYKESSKEVTRLIGEWIKDQTASDKLENVKSLTFSGGSK
jgi:hypothetical protein